MLGSAIIVLRETLEAALIVGILLAAVGTARHAKRWIAGGVAIGLIAASVVALFAEQIAAALEGTGQEYFNATVLLLAAGMLGWHHVWMKSHGRELARSLRDTGARVTSGAASFSALLIVVAIAVMREGSEVVLFLYGVAIGGASNRDILIGGVLGLIGGCALGALTYSGLARIPQRHLFSITGWLLVLLSAGMASQAAGYLTQVDLLPPLAEPLWNSAAILPEHSPLGQLFHVLIGYDEKPTGVQVLFFAATVTLILLLSRYVEKRMRMLRVASIAATLLAAALINLVGSNPAHAAHKVYSPIVEEGEYAIEVRGHHDFDSNPGLDGGQQFKIDLEHAPTARWLTEIVGEFEREPGGPLKTTALEWENVFQFTEQGAHWLDFGLLTEYEYELTDNSRNNLIMGALFEKSFNRQVANLNLIVEHALSSDTTNELSYAARWRWRANELFEPGIEVFGELGDAKYLGSFDSQEHSIGPSMLGAIRFKSGSKLRYEGAILAGVSAAAPNATVRLQFEY